MQGQRAQLNLQEPVKSAVYEFTGGAGVKFCGNETDGRATAVWEALERMRRVSERRVKRIAELPCPTGRCFEMPAAILELQRMNLV